MKKYLTMVLILALFTGCTASDDAEMDALKARIAELEEEATASTMPPATTLGTTTTEVLAASTLPPTTDAPATTAAPATTVVAPSGDDEEPPSPPTDVVCTGSGGSGEFMLSWAEPEDATDIFGVKVYISESGGAYSRLARWELSEEVVNVSGPRWMAVAYPIPEDVPVMLAVTHFDESGNESGWYPIEAYYSAPGEDCFSGDPSAPSLLTLEGGAGSGEVSLRLSAPDSDVASYQVWTNVEDGMVELSVLELRSVAGDHVVTAHPADWGVAADFRIVAVDAHGNTSSATEQSCPVNWASSGC